MVLIRLEEACVILSMGACRLQFLRNGCEVLEKKNNKILKRVMSSSSSNPLSRDRNVANWKVKCVMSGGIQGYTTLILNKFRFQTHKKKNLFSRNLLQIYDRNIDPIPSVWITSQQFCYFSLFLLIFLMLSLDFVISVSTF